MLNTVTWLKPIEMIELICAAYLNAKDWRPKTGTTVDSGTFVGGFSLSDVGACSECKKLGKNSCDNETTAIYCSANDKSVNFLNIEQLLNSFKKRQNAKTCDYLFYTDDYSSFVLNELSCSEYDYIVAKDSIVSAKTNKRQKAREQLKAVAEELLSMPETKAEIDKFSTCTALFSFRVKNETQIEKEEKDLAMKAMGAFIDSTLHASSLRAVEYLFDRFVWEERRYPAEFRF